MVLSSHQSFEADPHGSASGKPSSKQRFLAQCSIMSLLTGSLVAVFLAGGPKQGGMGLFLAVSGLVMIFLPAVRATSWWYWLVGLMLIVTTALSLLPKEVITIPAWRVELESLPLLRLPGSISCDELNTLFWVVVLGFSILIALYVISQPIEPRAFSNLALVGCLGCTAYAVLAWVTWQTGWHYPFYTKELFAEAGFGFFPNRNHTSGFLITGAILSLGLIYRGMNGGRLYPAILASGGLAVLTSSLLFFSKSRGGLLFLLFGIIIWLAGLGRYRSRLLVLGAGGVMIFTAVLFAGSGSILLQRLNVPGLPGGHTPHVASPNPSVGMESRKLHASGDGLSSDSRIAIWKDTLGMIRDFPFSGTGLGTYPVVYPFYAKASFADQRTALHAESDWLTLCAEGGVVSLLAAIACLMVLMLGIPRIAAASGREWPIRWAFVSAFFAELLHGLVDVPLHKPELGWWVLMLGAVGFGVNSSEGRGGAFAHRAQLVFFAIGGIGMISLGVLMICAQLGFALPLPWGAALPPFAPAAEHKRIITLLGENGTASASKAVEEGRAAISRYPMSQPLYFHLAVLELKVNGDIPRAKELFQIGRHLAAHDAALILVQGKELAPYDPNAAVSLWAESLRVQLDTCKNPNIKDPAYSMGMATGLFKSILSYAKEHPSFLAYIPPLASLDPKFRLSWLTSAACDPDQIAAAVADPEFMRQLTPNEQGYLFELWWRRGDWAAVAAFLNAHSEYDRSAAATMAASSAAAGQQEAACLYLIDLFVIPMPGELRASPSVRSAGRDIPDDPLAAAQYYMERGNDAAALRLLGEAMSGSTRAEALRLRAVMEIRARNWNAALGDIIGYLKARGEL